MSLRCDDTYQWIAIGSDRIEAQRSGTKTCLQSDTALPQNFIPRTFDYIQLFVISNGVNTRYFANNPNNGYKFTFNWTDAANVPFNDFQKFATAFFDKCTLGKIIGKYVVLHEGDKCLMVLRPYQLICVNIRFTNDFRYYFRLVLSV